MTNPRDPDSSMEELLRGALHGEAETVTPSGDGLARIQRRTARRGRRWLMPVAVVGGAALAAVAGFTAYAVTSAHHDERDSLANRNPTVIPSTPAASVSATPSKSPITGPVFPASAFYPFTSAAQEKSWEAQRGYIAEPWVIDPVAEAKNFIKSYVLADGVTTTMGTHIGSHTATVTLGRTLTDAGSKHPVKVTTVQLQRYGKAWLVTGAIDPNGNLTVSSPAAGARVTSPLTVSGPSYGVDESIRVDVATIGTRFAATSGRASFGNGSAPWSTSVAFAPPADPRGAIVVTEDSAADGGPARIVVSGVTFDAAQTGYPAYFYAVKSNRIAKFTARNGAALSYLTPPAVAGTTRSDAQVVGDQVFFLGGPACVNSIQSVPLTGGNPTTVATADPGYEITGYSVDSASAKVNTFYETACVAATSPPARLVINTLVNDTSQATSKVDFPGVPPGIVGDPSWDSDQQHFEAILRNGTQSQLVRYDAYGHIPGKPSDNVASCTGFDASGHEPLAVQVDANGYLWVATRTGSSMDVVRCIGSTAQVMFTVAGNRQPADIAVAGSGNAVLLTDTDGHVWRWTQGGNVTPLTPSVSVTQLSW